MPVSSRSGENSPIRRVLVVDDEPLIRWSLRTGLSRRGHQVAEAADGANALKLLSADPEQFHVVLLDYRLPDRQDLSLLRDVRRTCPSCAVIMMTAFADEQMRAEALACGARAVIDKPFQVAAVISMVESE
ncbi:MAG TPA: response regulator [Vicinamibacterales bacterium]|nr:response regulator [Vicinamibacterales bacterium]